MTRQEQAIEDFKRNYDYDDSYGVRPVCIFSSSIFESCEEDDD